MVAHRHLDDHHVVLALGLAPRAEPRKLGDPFHAVLRVGDRLVLPVEREARQPIVVRLQVGDGQRNDPGVDQHAVPVAHAPDRGRGPPVQDAVDHEKVVSRDALGVGDRRVAIVRPHLKPRVAVPARGPRGLPAAVAALVGGVERVVAPTVPEAPVLRLHRELDAAGQPARSVEDPALDVDERPPQRAAVLAPGHPAGRVPLRPFRLDHDGRSRRRHLRDLHRDRRREDRPERRAAVAVGDHARVGDLDMDGLAVGHQDLRCRQCPPSRRMGPARPQLAGGPIPPTPLTALLPVSPDEMVP